MFGRSIATSPGPAIGTETTSTLQQFRLASASTQYRPVHRSYRRLHAAAHRQSPPRSSGDLPSHSKVDLCTPKLCPADKLTGLPTSDTSPFLQLAHQCLRTVAVASVCLSCLFSPPASSDHANLPNHFLSLPPALAELVASPRRLLPDELATVQLFNESTPSVVYITNLAARFDP